MTDSFTRPPEELERRRKRAALYQTLRKENDQINAERNQKKSSGMDFFDDFGPSTEKKHQKLQGNIKTLAKQVKSCCSRLSTLNESTADGLIEQINQLNLSSFLDEVIQNLMAAKLQKNDIVGFVNVVSNLHQEYKEFEKKFFDTFVTEIKSSQLDEKRRKILFCTLGDLLIVHAFANLEQPKKLLIAIFHLLINDDIKNDDSFDNDSFIWEIVSYCGGDLFSVNRGSDSVIDPVFPKTAIIPDVRKNIGQYYQAITNKMKEKAEEGMEAREKSYKIFLQMGKMKTRASDQADKCRESYEALKSKALKYGFLMQKVPEEYWVEDEEMEEITTIDGSTLIPKRIFQQMESLSAFHDNDYHEQSNFYDELADLNCPVDPSIQLDVNGIHKELNKATDIHRIDELSLYYISIDTPSNRELLIKLISKIPKNNAKAAQYYARFVANVSRKIPDVGALISENLKEAYINFVSAQNHSQGKAAFHPKLNIARYICELTKFKISNSIDNYFECLKFSLDHFYGVTIDMTFTLIQNAGKFLEGLNIQTRIQINYYINKLKDIYKVEKYQFQPQIKTLIEQAIKSFEPEENSNEDVTKVNKYQAYTLHILQETNNSNKLKNTRRVLEKMWQASEETGVNQLFVITNILKLSLFNEQSFSFIAALVTDISRTHKDFGVTLVDILLERIRRGIEVKRYLFKQRQFLEMRFLGELINSKLIAPEIGFDTAKQILSLKMPILNTNTNHVPFDSFDFFRARLVCQLLSTLTPIIKEIYGIQNENNQNRNNSNFSNNRKKRNRNDRFSYSPPDTTENKELQARFQDILLHLQAFCLVRSPTTPTISYEISNLFNTLREIPDISKLRYETFDDIKTKAPNFPTIDKSIYYITEKSSQLNIRKKRDDIALNNSSDESDTDDSETDSEEREFIRQYNEVLSDFRAEEKEQIINKKQISIPIELMNSETFTLNANEKMTLDGPPKAIDFNIAIPGEKNLTISFKAPENK